MSRVWLGSATIELPARGLDQPFGPLRRASMWLSKRIPRVIWWTVSVVGFGLAAVALAAGNGFALLGWAAIGAVGILGQVVAVLAVEVRELRARPVVCRCEKRVATRAA